MRRSVLEGLGVLGILVVVSIGATQLSQNRSVEEGEPQPPVEEESATNNTNPASPAEVQAIKRERLRRALIARGLYQDDATFNEFFNFVDGMDEESALRVFEAMW